MAGRLRSETAEFYTVSRRGALHANLGTDVECRPAISHTEAVGRADGAAYPSPWATPLEFCIPV
jgi:hypothetical protein